VLISLLPIRTNAGSGTEKMSLLQAGEKDRQGERSLAAVSEKEKAGPLVGSGRKLRWAQA